MTVENILEIINGNDKDWNSKFFRILQISFVYKRAKYTNVIELLENFSYKKVTRENPFVEYISKDGKEVVLYIVRKHNSKRRNTINDVKFGRIKSDKFKLQKTYIKKNGVVYISMFLSFLKEVLETIQQTGKFDDDSFTQYDASDYESIKDILDVENRMLDLDDKENIPIMMPTLIQPPPPSHHANRKLANMPLSSILEMMATPINGHI